MNRAYSILKVTNPITGQFAFIVCSTLNDEVEEIRHAEHKGYKVTNVVAGEDSCEGIFINEISSSL